MSVINEKRYEQQSQKRKKLHIEKMEKRLICHSIEILDPIENILGKTPTEIPPSFTHCDCIGAIVYGDSLESSEEDGDQATPWLTHALAMKQWHIEVEQIQKADNLRPMVLDMAENARTTRPIYTAWWKQSMLLEKLCDFQDWPLAYEVALIMKNFLTKNDIVPPFHDSAFWASWLRGFGDLDSSCRILSEGEEFTEKIVALLLDLGYSKSSLLDDLVSHYLHNGKMDEAITLLAKTGKDHARWSFVMAMVCGKVPLVRVLSEKQFDISVRSHFLDDSGEEFS